MKKFVLIVFCAALLSACSGMGLLRATKPNTVINAQGPTGAGYGRAGVPGLVDALERDYLVSYCLSGGEWTLGKGTDDKGKLIVNPACGVLYDVSKNPALSTVTGFYKPANATEATAAMRLTDSGFRLSKSVCLSYFKRIGDQGQDNNFYQKAVNALGGVAAATLGLTGSPSKSIALTATGFSGFLSGLESFETVYHFTPDRQAIVDLIVRSMDAYELELKNAKPPQNFNDAINAIQSYQSICQTDYIQKTVNDALSKAEVRAPSTSNTDRLLRLVVTGSVRSDLGSTLGTTGIVSEAHVTPLAQVYLGLLPADLDALKQSLSTSGINLVTGTAPSLQIDGPLQTKLIKWFDDLAQSDRPLFDQIMDNARRQPIPAGTPTSADKQSITVGLPQVQ